MLSEKLCFLAPGQARLALGGALLCLLVFVSCGKSTRLATVHDIPAGRLAQPGGLDPSGIMLGNYNTCKAYADYVASRPVSGGLPTSSAYSAPQLSMGQALNPDHPVYCAHAHTCNCLHSVYFREDFRGQHPPIYYCVESPLTGVEQATVYNSGKPGQGVIKFALPRSACESWL